MSVTASLCGQGCKRVKKRFVFSVRETRPCCYSVSEHNAAKQPGSLSISPFRAETELDLLWNSCAVFTSKATWTSNVLRFVFHLKLRINWCLFKSMAWEHGSANAERLGWMLPFLQMHAGITPAAQPPARALTEVMWLPSALLGRDSQCCTGRVNALFLTCTATQRVLTYPLITNSSS